MSQQTSVGEKFSQQREAVLILMGHQGARLRDGLPTTGTLWPRKPLGDPRCQTEIIL